MKNKPFKLEQSAKEIKNDPSTYILSEPLKKAVDVALLLNQPLILTGEPGTGKTQLAYKLASELSKQTQDEFLNKPLEFHTKTTTTAQDLFYSYDAIGHFRDSNNGDDQENKSAKDYIALQALGKAIALTNSEYLTSEACLLPPNTKPQSTVVLIDEIDKAPRDFPNDILNEIEQYVFRIKEMRAEIKKSDDKRILVIMTSNSEKSLPEPFLRRCVFYHIPFPEPDQLLEIVSQKIANLDKVDDDKIKKSIAYFNAIRERVKKKEPATSELISWLHVLETEQFFDGTLDFGKLTETQKNILRFSFSVLLKDKDDLKEIVESL